MARPLRIAIEDGWYHVVNRGIEQRSIFTSPADDGHFLQLLAQLPARFGFLVLSGLFIEPFPALD
jgi:hypothetical protein